MEARYGVEFLGAYVLPYRKYMSNKALARTIDKIRKMNTNDVDATYRSVNSFLGTFSHYSSYNIKCNIFLQEKFLKIAPFDRKMTKMLKPR